MRKEILLAILIGLVLGLFITYGVYQAKTSLGDREQSTVTITNGEEVVSDEVVGKLTIISPEDESIQKDKNVLITGNTQASNYIVIFVNEVEIITVADEVGNFSTESQLKDGFNTIIVNSLDEDGNNTKKSITVIVTQEALTEEENFLTNQLNASESAQLDQEEE